MRERYTRNLLQGLLPDGFQNTSPTAKLGSSPEQVEEANRAFGGVLIGWIVTRTDSTPDAETPVCEDLALTLSILSRRIGNLYLGRTARIEPRRQRNGESQSKNHTMNHLFHSSRSESERQLRERIFSGAGLP